MLARPLRRLLADLRRFRDELPRWSHAQVAEDRRLLDALGSVRCGTYVDVGAHDPDVMSVTRRFYDRGWSGINIEPGPLFERLAQRRPRDTNHRVAVHDRARSLTLTVPRSGTGLATVGALDPGIPEWLRSDLEQRTVPARRLDELLAPLTGREIHFLKVDVEGSERAVLESNDWERHRPWIVVVESVLPLSSTPCRHLWSDVLESAGYRLAYFDGLNDFWVRDDLGDHIDRALGRRRPVPVELPHR